MDPRQFDRDGAAARYPGTTPSSAADFSPRRRALAQDAVVGHEYGQGVCPKRTPIVALYTAPPQDATIRCVDEVGPVTPRNFPPAPGWSPSGHRIKVPLDYARGTEKGWVYGALCIRDGQALT